MGIFFFPYATDAPLYHLPIVTVSMIVLNVALFFGAVTGYLPDQDAWLLTFGNGLHPVEWLSANFMHLDLGHLLGNMAFLWVYGLVTEGKLGWWRFLGLYMAIAVCFGALQQVFALGYSGPVPGGMGASAVIWGLLGMALVWAPRNEVNFAGIWFVFVMFKPIFFSVSVLTLGMVFAGWEFLLFWLTGFSVSSAAAHLLGGTLGFAAGIALLKHNVVDGEGYDLIAVLKGREGNYVQLEARLEERRLERQAETQRQKQWLHEAQQQLTAYLENRSFAAAAMLYKKMSDTGNEVQLDEKQLMALIQGLHSEQRWNESLDPMEHYVRQFPQKADRVRLKLAQIYLQQQKQPEAALAHLTVVAAASLPEPLDALRRRMTKIALTLQETSDNDLALDR